MGETVYAASCSGVLFAYDRRSGEVRWSYDTSLDGPSAQFHGDPVVVDDLLVIPSDAQPAGHVYAFALETGEVRWKTPVSPGGVTSHLVRAGPLVIGLTATGRLTALDLETGAERWSVEPEAEPGQIGINTHPALAGERVYYGAPDGKVRSVSVESGEVAWVTDLGSRPNTGVSIDGEHLLIGAVDKHLYRLALEDGTVAARLELPAVPVGTATLTGDALVLVLGEGYIVAVDRGLEGIPWIYRSTSPWNSFQPLVEDGRVIAGTGDGELYAFALADGSVLWKGELAGTLRGIGAAGGVYYVGTLQGTVYAFAPDDAGLPVADPLAWLTGRWRGRTENGWIEEIWSDREGNDRMGMFRAIANGTVEMYEFMTIRYGEPGGPTLRLKHFGRDLDGWEPADESEVLDLLPGGSRTAVFVLRDAEVPTRLTYTLEESGELSVVLERKRPQGTSRTEFRFARD